MLLCGLAQDTFREENGAPSLERMIGLIAPLKKEKVTLGTPIGCVILRDPFFFPRDQWIQPPDDFAKMIVVGKGYDLTTSPGREM